MIQNPAIQGGGGGVETVKGNLIAYQPSMVSVVYTDEFGVVRSIGYFYGEKVIKVQRGSILVWKQGSNYRGDVSGGLVFPNEEVNTGAYVYEVTGDFRIEGDRFGGSN